jgi:tRNA threonylcarbamoyladenosine biosynthesis protein TsaE
MICKSSKETEDLAVNVASKIGNIKVLYLYGDLGSGKTTFTKAFVEALGIEKFYVKSPTYTYIREYKLDRVSIFHIDLYRIEQVDHLLTEEIGEIAERENVLLVIEWAEKLQEKLSQKSLSISFEYIDENKRELTFTPKMQF